MVKKTCSGTFYRASYALHLHINQSHALFHTVSLLLFYRRKSRIAKKKHEIKKEKQPPRNRRCCFGKGAYYEKRKELQTSDRRCGLADRRHRTCTLHTPHQLSGIPHGRNRTEGSHCCHQGSGGRHRHGRLRGAQGKQSCPDRPKAFTGASLLLQPRSGVLQHPAHPEGTVQCPVCNRAGTQGRHQTPRAGGTARRALLHRLCLL